MPGIAHFLNHIQVQVAHDQFFVVSAAQVADELALGIAEITLAVKVVIAVFFDADAIAGADIVGVEDGVRGLLDAPEMLAQSARGGRWNEDHFGAVQAQGAGAFREVAVVADVDADLAHGGIKDGITQVARAEIEFLPEAGQVRDMRFAVFAQVAAIGVDDDAAVL